DKVIHLFAPIHESQGQTPGTPPGRPQQPQPGQPQPPQGAQKKPPGRPQMQMAISNKGYHATSNDGLTFQRTNDVEIDGRRRWLGNAQNVDGKMVFMGSAARNMPGAGGGAAAPAPGGFWMAESSDGKTWTLLDKTPEIRGGDPAGVKSKDGGWI